MRLGPARGIGFQYASIFPTHYHEIVADRTFGLSYLVIGAGLINRGIGVKETALGQTAAVGAVDGLDGIHGQP